MAGFFGFFDYLKPGKGVNKDERESRLKIFFRVLFTKYRKLMLLSAMYLICSMPLIALMFLLAPLPKVNEPEQIIKLFFYSVLCLLYLSVVGLAPAITGFTYVLRNFARQEHAWVVSDFFETVRKNFKQSMALLLIDMIAVYILFANYEFYAANEATGIFMDVTKVMVVVIALIYYMMHFYIYQILITFDMKLKHLFRNALLLTLINLPKNLGILIFITAIAIATFSFSIVIGVFLSVVLSVFLIGFVVNFFVEPNIKKYMMEPSLTKDKNMK